MTRHTVPDAPVGLLSDAWRQCVGTGRLDLSLRADHRESLRVAQEEIGFRYIRGHGLLSDLVGVHRAYERDGRRGVRHVFTYVDQVFDAYLEAGVRPFVELGFMPKDLASGDRTVFWWDANVTPPHDLRSWTELVRGLLQHLVQRYGAQEVRTWPVEVWNEPNLPDFWSGSMSDYHELYAATALTVQEVDADLQVGGPALSPGADDWWAPFADLIERRDLPADFVSFHAYTTGPAQHVPFGVYQTVRAPSALIEQLGRPRSLLAGTRLADVPQHVTEFSSSYRPDNPVHDTAYQAAYLAPVLARGGDLVDSFSYWTLCDVFEEQGIPAALFHGGFGLLTHRQVRKPAFHTYAFWARAGRHVLARGEDHLVTRHDDGRVVVIAWQPVGGTDDPQEPERHELRLSVPVRHADGAPARTAYVGRSDVDEHAGNAFTAWRELGRPASPTLRQLDALQVASEPAHAHRSLDVVAGRVGLDLTLGRHGVTLVEIEPVRDETPDWIEDARILGRSVS